jgi:hypothetical protein
MQKPQGLSGGAGGSCQDFRAIEGSAPATRSLPHVLGTTTTVRIRTVRSAHSTSEWERTIAIVATSHWIEKGMFGPTRSVADLLLREPPDLIHKAVGWMLREVEKRDRQREEAVLATGHPWAAR